MRKHWKKILILVQIIFFLFPAFSLALELDYPEIGGFEISLDMDLNELVAWFYYFIVGIAGLAAFGSLIWGGFLWLTSAGNASRISEAKERINSALWGLILILASYLILKAINPELVTLNLPSPLETL